MFGLFKKKQPTAMNALIRAVYGDHPPKKSADCERAITISHEDILSEMVPLSDVRNVASGLFAGPMPYSTHDLAVATALSFYKKPEYFDALQTVQLGARLRVLNWMKDGKVAPGVTKIFEDTLYAAFKPSGPVVSSQPSSPAEAIVSDQDDQIELFRKRNTGRAVGEIAEFTHKFMVWQHNFAGVERPDEYDDDEHDHAERIERAFLFGATQMAAEAYSVSDDNELLTAVVVRFHGLEDDDEIELELERTFEAIDQHEEAMWAGREAMTDYVLKGRTEAEETRLAALQDVAWIAAREKNALDIQQRLQQEFAALEINFMELHPLIHGSILREAISAGIASALRHFHEYAEYAAGLDTTDDEKARILLDLYREHERTVDEALKGAD